LDWNLAVRIHKLSPVKFLFAATFRDAELLADAVSTIVSEVGEIDHKSAVFLFDHTQYYAQEMGQNLSKQFMSFRTLRPFEFLVDLKHILIKLEEHYSTAGNRGVNLDPAYMELGKLVVASTKNFDHRIYLGEGIYGDVQLRYRKGTFVDNPWTYPDYKSAAANAFFHQVRETYYHQLQDRP